MFVSEGSESPDWLMQPILIILGFEFLQKVPVCKKSSEVVISCKVIDICPLRVLLSHFSKST